MKVPRSRKWHCAIFLLLTSTITSVSGQDLAEKPRPAARLGMNLAAPSDYATELPFVDVFRTARPWVSQKRGAAWGAGPELAIDELGWVKSLQPDCYAEALLCTIPGGVSACRAGATSCALVLRGGALITRPHDVAAALIT